MWFLLACSGPAPISTGQDSPVETGVEVIEGDGPSTLVINEFMAGNDRTLADATGAFPDWLELYNPEDELVDLDHWTLVVDGKELELEGEVPAGGTRVLLLSGNSGLGPDHLDGRLSLAGGELELIDARGLQSDALVYPAQATDISAARIPDGAEAWSLTSTPTPDAANEGPIPDDSAWGASEGTCGLAPQTAVNFLEGDSLTLPLTCENNPSAELLAVRVPGDATVDPYEVTWQTTLADAGRYDLVFASRTLGAIDEIPTAEGFSLWVADDGLAEGNEPVDPLLYTEEWGLPVFHIQTEDSIPQSYVAASVQYEGVDYTAEIKVRGASSSSYPKQSYTLAFEDVELPVEAWPETRDRIVLVTTFDDNAYVRQKLIYDQWLAMAEHWEATRMTPRAYFAVVYLNGEYHGLYTALDHVDDEFLEHMGLTRDANLYKAVNHDANFYAKSNLHSGYEKKEGAESDYTDLDALIDFTGNSTYEELIAGAEDWLDLGEFMDWFLLVHYSEAADSAGKNSYLYNDPWNRGFKFAPWDFNHAWGQNWYTARVPVTQLQDFASRNRVFAAIHDQQSEVLWERFRSMRDEGGPMSTTWIEAQMDGYFALIEPSAERDWARWEQEYMSYSRWSGNRSGNDNWTDYQGEKEYLYTWVRERGELFETLYP